MYVQPPMGDAPVQLPKEYHGTVFAPAEETGAPPEVTETTSSASEASAPPVQEVKPPTAQEGEDPGATQTGARVSRGLFDGLLGRCPLLSSLLPPSRGERANHELLTWVLLGAAVLLLLDDRTDDILPLLLILLLWD